MNPFGKKNSPDKKRADDATCADAAHRAAAELRIVAVNAISEAKAAEWDACANPIAHRDGEVVTQAAPSSDQEIPYNPFLSHDFLSALEVSKSVGGHSGWLVQHLLVRDADGSLVAAAGRDVPRRRRPQRGVAPRPFTGVR